MNRAFDHFPLRGLSVGISISAGDSGIPGKESPDFFVNKVTYQTCSRFLNLGARIVTGHMWRPDGIMQHLAKRAADFSSMRAPNEPRPIFNRVAWPDEPPASGDSDNDVGWLLQFIDSAQIPPPGIPLDGLDLSSPLGKYARMRALTAMRQQLVMESDFRLCLGGTEGKPLRRIPGVLEEAQLTVNAGKPLYLSGVFGGISKLICDAVLHRKMTDEARGAFFTPDASLELYGEFHNEHPFPLDEGPSEPGGSSDALAVFASLSVTTLAERAHLSEDEYLALMTTPDLERALDLARTGVLRSAVE